MTANPRSVRNVGLVQILLAATFVIWLLLFPSTGDKFAWPVTPRLTAMFIGAGFIVRTFIGYFLWREPYWYRLRWQRWGNYAFLAFILLATLWHVDEMNWKSDIIVAHIWVVAYIAEPLILPLLEPRRPVGTEAYPDAERKGPVMEGLKRVSAFGLVASVTVGGLMVMNPAFIDTRWPWALDPFNARVMAAFFALTALWCVTIYLAEDWAEVRMAELGLAIFAVSQFAVWLVNLGQFDPARENIAAYGIGFGLFALLFIYYFWRHERLGASFQAAHLEEATAAQTMPEA